MHIMHGDQDGKCSFHGQRLWQYLQEEEFWSTHNIHQALLNPQRDHVVYSH